ncbi:MAG: hypothetical protein ABSA13_16455 [Beijerinckiaceae bacterium]|jgi:hypothetical protein
MNGYSDDTDNVLKCSGANHLAPETGISDAGPSAVLAGPEMSSESGAAHDSDPEARHSMNARDGSDGGAPEMQRGKPGHSRKPGVGDISGFDLDGFMSSFGAAESAYREHLQMARSLLPAGKKIFEQLPVLAK